MSETNKAAADAAAHLLANRHHHRTEGNVQSDLEALIRTLGVGTILSHYQMGNEQADIYLPNRRTFFEVKAHPKAEHPEKPQGGASSESPREQLDRYVLAEMRTEIERPELPGISGGVPDAPWTGVVTDGAHWHVYRYPHAPASSGELYRQATFANEARALVGFLADALGTEMVGKEWIPERPGELFADLKDELDALYYEMPKKAVRPTATKRELWLDMMRTSGMVPGRQDAQERLFLAHSFLIVVTRMVSHTLAGRRSEEEWMSALGDGFASWVLDFSRGTSWAERVWQLVDEYDWRRRRSDVLRDLYHRYVDARDRQVFGEYYTPDWLAELMVEEVLDEQWLARATTAAHSGEVDGIGVLDPACGSGTFLYHAARRIADSKALRKLDLRPVQQADIVARLVNGMEYPPRRRRDRQSQHRAGLARGAQ